MGSATSGRISRGVPLPLLLVEHDKPWPLIAIEAPCAIRDKALAVLVEHGIRHKVVAEAGYLAGVLNGGLGRPQGHPAGPGRPAPEGLVVGDGLPAAQPISLMARARDGADMTVVRSALGAVRSALAAASGERRRASGAGHFRRH